MRGLDTNRLFFSIGSLASAAQMIAQGPSWLEWLGYALAALAILVLVFGGRIDDGFRIRFGGPFWRRRVNPYAVVMAISTLVLVTAALGYWADLKRGPIVWTIGTVESPLGWSGSSGGPLWIDAFQIHGRERWGDAITVRRAYIRSDATGREAQLQFLHEGIERPLAEMMILPEGHFVLFHRLPATEPTKSQGISGNEFRQEFPKFTFVFESDDRPLYKRQFSTAEVDKFLALYEKAKRESEERVKKTMLGNQSGVAKRNK